MLCAAIILLPLLATIASAAAANDLAIVRPVIACADLASIDLTAIGDVGSKVSSATETNSSNIAVCSVEGKLAPEINFQVLLPVRTWTQRYLQTGCGGLCGRISLESGASNGCQVLNDGGFVMAATDMGHSGNDASWGQDAQKRVDFAYRAQHLTAETAKALIAAFYGQPQKFSYFNGCSDGGREALMEAQRYPDDFDGVIAGAPAMLFQVQNTLYHGWQAVSNTTDDGSHTLLSAALPILHKAVIAACGETDGVKDGIIAQPAACNFDISTITCKPDTADALSCLSKAEAEVAQRFHDGPKDAASGAYLTAGQPLYGSELNWQGVYVPDAADGSIMSTMAALPVLRYLAFAQARPDLEIEDLAFTQATLDALRPRHPLFDSTNADLSAFAKTGGKLIMWHGLADPHISPANTVALHKAMIAHLGEANVEAFERLYLLPGVSHCGGGQGPGNLDLLTAVMAWVEQGAAPDVILTSTEGKPSTFGQPGFSDDNAKDHGPPPMQKLDVEPLPAMTRPVYPYPHTARYKDAGDVTSAANWEKGPPAKIVKLREWPGADLFSPYSPAAE
jgi:feruloyl esterase